MSDATPHFTDQNTQGYSAGALAELNRRFDAAVAAAEPIPDDVRKSHLDHIAARVEAEFVATEGWIR